MWQPELLNYVWLSILTLVCFCLSVPILFLRGRSHRHPTLEKRLRSVEAEQIALLDELDKLNTYAKKKYHRDAMRESRKKSTSDTGIPDPQTDPEGWKKHMQRQFALGGKH